MEHKKIVFGKKVSKSEIKNHYSTVYITLISILLGIALGDLVSIFRDLKNPDYFEWLTLTYIVLIIMNAWVAYSLHAISIKLIPVPGDAVNVFAISISHFAINSFIGKPHYQIYMAVAVYLIISCFSIGYIVKRATYDSSKNFTFKPYIRVLSLNVIGAVLTIIAAFLSYKDLLSKTTEIILFLIAYLFIVFWLILFWKTWKKGI